MTSCRIARDHGAAMHLAGVQAVRPDAHQLLTWDGRTLDYELLLVAVGAQPDGRDARQRHAPGSRLHGPLSHRAARARAAPHPERRLRRPGRRVLAAAALRAGADDRGARRRARPAPRRAVARHPRGGAARAVRPGRFRRRARAAGRARRGPPHRSRYPADVQRAASCRSCPAGSVCRPTAWSACPACAGPFLPGLPHDAEGFIPTDLHGLVEGEHDVYAAGDATTCPIKQGGIATQQADAAAEAIAARAGADVEPAPFRPVLRGLLLTGDDAPLPARRGAAARRATRRAPPSRRSGGRPARSPAAGSLPTSRCTTASSTAPEEARRRRPTSRAVRVAALMLGPPARQRPAGSQARATVVPRCRAPSRSRDRPPTSSTRSRMPISPKPPSVRLPGRSPTPSSLTVTVSVVVLLRRSRRSPARRRRA